MMFLNKDFCRPSDKIMSVRLNYIVLTVLYHSVLKHLQIIQH